MNPYSAATKWCILTLTLVTGGMALGVLSPTPAHASCYAPQVELFPDQGTGSIGRACPLHLLVPQDDYPGLLNTDTPLKLSVGERQIEYTLTQGEPEVAYQSISSMGEDGKCFTSTLEIIYTHLVLSPVDLLPPGQTLLIEAENSLYLEDYPVSLTITEEVSADACGMPPTPMPWSCLQNCYDTESGLPSDQNGTDSDRDSTDSEGGCSWTGTSSLQSGSAVSLGLWLLLLAVRRRRSVQRF